MGALVAHQLRERDHDVVPASRATGVDATTGVGLPHALEGADTLLDCTNRQAVRRRDAVGFFTSVAERVSQACAAAGVGHVVVLSILNVTDQPVRQALGYYAGKAAHEETYVASGLPTSIVSTTAWFSLARQFLSQARVGRVAVVPDMMLQPVHPEAAATLLADVVEAGPPPDGTTARHRLAGPERLCAAVMARDLAARTDPGPKVLAAPFPPSREFRQGALLPRGTVQTDTRRFSDWLTTQG